ncbi:MAG: hypothetical protein R3C11_18200 [Planctomycetaceae bacterium]
MGVEFAGAGTEETDLIQDQLLSRQLRIAHDYLNQEYTEAFSRCLEMISFVREHPQTFIEQEGKLKRKIRVDVWLAGELEEIWNLVATEGQESVLEELLQPYFQNVDINDVEQLKLYSRLFTFHSEFHRSVRSSRWRSLEQRTGITQNVSGGMH